MDRESPTKSNKDDRRLDKVTVHGIRFNKKSGKPNSKKVDDRRNSLRRLDRASLLEISQTQKPGVAEAAKVELDTRTELANMSAQQASHGNNRWQQGMSDSGVDALRYGASLAEEAVDSLMKGSGKNDQPNFGKGDIPKQLGYAEIDGQGGLGFSGGEANNEEASQVVMDRMIEHNNAQKQSIQDDHAKTEDGLGYEFPHSTTFDTVQVPRVTPEVTNIGQPGKERDRQRVCAAHRAGAAAVFGGQGGEVQTSEVPSHGSTIEVANNAFGGNALNELSEFQASNGNNQHPPVVPIPDTMARRNSTNNVMNSCQGCSEEHAQQRAAITIQRAFRHYSANKAN